MLVLLWLIKLPLIGLSPQIKQALIFLHFLTLSTCRVGMQGEILPSFLQNHLATTDHPTEEHWLSTKNGFDDQRDPNAAFNLLDKLLKDTLERLKTMRLVSSSVSNL